MVVAGIAGAGIGMFLFSSKGKALRGKLTQLLGIDLNALLAQGKDVAIRYLNTPESNRQPE